MFQVLQVPTGRCCISFSTRTLLTPIIICKYHIKYASTKDLEQYIIISPVRRYPCTRLVLCRTDGGMNIILYCTVGVTDGSVCERPLVGDVETLAPLVGGRVGPYALSSGRPRTVRPRSIGGSSSSRLTSAVRTRTMRSETL